MRLVLKKYGLETTGDLFDRAYAYIHEKLLTPESTGRNDMPRSKGRDLAGVPNGTLVFTKEAHSGRQRKALVAAGQIWLERTAYGSASGACKAMQGVVEVNGWDHLDVLVDSGFVPLAEAYDEHFLRDPPRLKRAQLREFLGDVRPESLGLVPADDTPRPPAVR